MEKGVSVVLFGIFILAVAMYVYQSYGTDVLGNAFSFDFLRTTPPLPASPGERVEPVPPSPNDQGTQPVEPGELSLPTPPPSNPLATTTVNGEELPIGFFRKDISPYYHKVRMGYLAAGGSDYSGQFTLHASFDGDERAPISGWLVKGYRTSHFIPRAVNVVDPLNLTEEGDILLGRGESFVLFTGLTSPLGKNFRPNKCMGYMENSTPFTPSLPRYCPVPQRDEVKTFTSICYDYALSLGSCVEPLSDPPVPVFDDACRIYLKQFNFASCFAKHRGDSDFLYPEWRAYTTTEFLDPRHDRLLLLDRAGLLVDLVEY